MRGGFLRGGAAVILSPLPIETCQARLRENLARPLGPPRAGDVAGRVDGDAGRLRKRVDAGRLGPAAVVFRMEKMGETTRLSCKAQSDALPPWMLALCVIALLAPAPLLWGRWLRDKTPYTSVECIRMDDDAMEIDSGLSDASSASS